MATSWVSAVALILACAVVCPAALAADEEAAQTGIIGVQVVYKDTGEPVEGAYVSAVSQEGAEEQPFFAVGGRVSSSGRITFAQVPLGKYQVTVADPPSFSSPSQTKRYYLDALERGQEVVLTTDSPTQRVRFDAERGWELTGVVRHSDGSPLKEGIALIRPGQNAWRSPSEGQVDEEGRFCLTGLQPASTVTLQILGWARVLAKSGGGWGHTVVLWEGECVLAQEKSVVDIEVETAAVDVTLDLIRPVWPFSRDKTAGLDAIGLRFGEPRGALLTMPDLFWDSEACAMALYIAPPKIRHEFSVVGLRQGACLTLAVGRNESRHGLGDACVFGSPEREIRLGRSTQAVHLPVYDSRARLSYALWFAVVGAIALAICVPILARQMRRRRAKETAT